LGHILAYVVDEPFNLSSLIAVSKPLKNSSKISNLSGNFITDSGFGDEEKICLLTVLIGVLVENSDSETITGFSESILDDELIAEKRD
jgi:hypothetical protein